MSVTDGERDVLNSIPGGAASKLGHAIGCVRAVYDFSKKGGAIGDIDLGVKIPKGAIVLNVVVDVITAPTSGGAATVALKSKAAADLMAATAIASVTGMLVGKPDFATAGDFVKMTAEVSIKATIATAALTAGKFYVFVFYVMSETT